MTIGVALFDGAEELDWAGPWEVLAAWAQQWPDDGVHFFTRTKVVTSRWLDPSHGGVDLGFPQNE